MWIAMHGAWRVFAVLQDQFELAKDAAHFVHDPIDRALRRIRPWLPGVAEIARANGDAQRRCRAAGKIYFDRLTDVTDSGREYGPIWRGVTPEFGTDVAVQVAINFAHRVRLQKAVRTANDEGKDRRRRELLVECGFPAMPLRHWQRQESARTADGARQRLRQTGQNL